MVVDPGLRSARAHVVVEDLESPVLDAADHHHLGRVLRLRAGEAVTVTDGAGRWRPCRLRDPGRGALEVVGPVAVQARPEPTVAVLFAPPRGADTATWTVRKLTELGVDRIGALVTDRGVVRWDSHRREAQLDRWRRVARSATGQARRCWLPAVEGPVELAAAARMAGVALAEPGGGAPSPARPCILVGPEGGWSPEEAAALRDVARVGLGPFVLRAETAALAAAALMCGLRSDLVSPGPTPGS